MSVNQAAGKGRRANRNIKPAGQQAYVAGQQITLTPGGGQATFAGQVIASASSQHFTNTQQAGTSGGTASPITVFSSTGGAPNLSNAIFVPVSASGNNSTSQVHQMVVQNANGTVTMPTPIQQVHQVQLMTSNSKGGNDIWACPSCKIPFKTALLLQQHLTSHTSGDKSVPCEMCGKMFLNAERVRIHVRVAHGDKSCGCPICGAGFSYRCKLVDHMRTHNGEKPFQCEVCLRSFSQKNHLRRHNMIHSGERPYTCEFCNRGFYRKDKLNRHKKTHSNPPRGQRAVATSSSPFPGTSASSKSTQQNAQATPIHGNIFQVHTAGGELQLIPVTGTFAAAPGGGLQLISPQGSSGASGAQVLTITPSGQISGASAGGNGWVLKADGHHSNSNSTTSTSNGVNAANASASHQGHAQAASEENGQSEESSST